MRIQGSFMTVWNTALMLLPSCEALPAVGMVAVAALPAAADVSARTAVTGEAAAGETMAPPPPAADAASAGPPAAGAAAAGEAAALLEGEPDAVAKPGLLPGDAPAAPTAAVMAM